MLIVFRVDAIPPNQPVLAGGESQGRNNMKKPPWHSKLASHRGVYHDESACTEGDNIEAYNRVSGTGGRPKCDHCIRISG